MSKTKKRAMIKSSDESGSSEVEQVREGDNK